MSDLTVTIDIARSPDLVRRWWLDFPDDYRADDPREQPHRILTIGREDSVRRLLTFWRGPFGREIEVPETLRVLDDLRWTFEIALPFGLRQRDEFTLTPTPTGTRVTIQVDVTAPSILARVARPLFMLYARRQYARTWRSAGRLCEKATAPPAPRDPWAARTQE